MSIWHQDINLETLNRQMCRRNMLQHLDIVFTEIGPDHVSARMPVDWRTHQPAGILHGGASVVLAETVGSVAANLCIDMEHYACVGQEINANHLRAKKEGWIIGTARPVHIGQRSQVWDIHIVDEEEKLICISRLTMATIKNVTDTSTLSR
jgi:1,4-dihydroxy-2-naphthoyl-CoA hydrolase